MAGRAGERAGTFDVARRRVAAARWLRIPRGLRGVATQAGAWAQAEVAPGRLMPWLPIAFGAGILLYFAAEREPVLLAALGLLAALVVATFFARRRPFAFPLLLAIAAAAAGFAAATAKSAMVAHTLLRWPASDVSITGWIEVREDRPRTDRIVVKVQTIEGRRLDELPERVRVSVAKGAAPPVGSFVAFKARLEPPLEPLRPGGYDFARDLYFQGIGASGFGQGPIKLSEPPAPPGAWLRYSAVLDAMRNAIDARIRANLGGDVGAIASALITGKRDAISPAVNDAMYVSSLAHVLSISG